MAILGHKTLSEAERYTRQVDQARLASTAITKLEGRATSHRPFGQVNSGMKGRLGQRATWGANRTYSRYNPKISNQHRDLKDQT